MEFRRFFDNVYSSIALMEQLNGRSTRKEWLEKKVVDNSTPFAEIILTAEFTRFDYRVFG